MNGMIGHEASTNQNSGGFLSRMFGGGSRPAQTVSAYDDQEETKSQTEISDRGNDDNPDDADIPLMEDLGIDIQEIKGNFKSVIMFKQFDEKFARDLDLIGPLIIAFALAFTMSLVLHNLS